MSLPQLLDFGVGTYSSVYFGRALQGELSSLRNEIRRPRLLSSATSVRPLASPSRSESK